MRVLLVGSGGREHALAWKLRQSPSVEALLWAPGNAGAAGLCETAPIKAEDVKAVVALAASFRADLVVVGPEAPLAQGLADALAGAGISCFGPSRAAARLESSKVFCKDFCVAHGIPTAPYRVFDDAASAGEYLGSYAGPFPLVLKADGLAAGKGVLICQDRDEALDGAQRILARREFGAAGERMLVEDFLPGEEASLMVFTDGERIAPMPPARDHKRALDGDKGANTGGMGALCPASRMSPAQMDEALERIVRPVLAGMAAEGSAYRGVLYAGLMLTAGGPSLLEINCRFGDPETQVVLPLLDGDLAQIAASCAEGRLDPKAVRWRPGFAVTVVMASGGYPGAYATGKRIEGLEEACGEGVVVFQAGTRMEAGRTLTAGGRVLDVTGIAGDAETARRAAYEAVSKIRFEGAHYRTDIAGG